MNEDFPWGMFGYVVEYDSVEGAAVSKVQNACEARGIKYVSLKVVIPEKSERTVSSSHGIEEKDSHGKYQLRTTPFSCC